MPMYGIPPLGEKAWENLMRVMRRGETEEQRERYRDSERVFRETRWGDDSDGHGIRSER
ncbi:MAG: hypothetical protein MPL62_12225 [Alphaproteobacteria bacterium]|nr:hypothetical protein [Alphaproteobacteria bacterium]